MMSPALKKESLNQLSDKNAIECTQSTCVSGKEMSTMRRNFETDEADEKPKNYSSFFGLASGKKIENVPEFDDSDEDSSVDNDDKVVQKKSAIEQTKFQRPGIKLFAKG